MPQKTSVISNINFLKLWAAQFTSQIGLNALYFILAIKIYLLTGSNTAVGILIITFTAPSIFLAYLAGVYVDQFSLKRVMLITNLVRSLVVILLILFINQIYLLFGLVFLMALATLFFIPAEGSALPALVTDSELISANSLFSFTLQISLVVGFLVGGFSLRVFGETQTLLGILATFVISLLLNILLPKSIRSEVESSEHSVLKRFIDGIIFVVKNKKVRDAIFFLTLTTTVIFILATIGTGYVDKILHGHVKSVTGLVILPATIGMAVGSLILSDLGNRFSDRRLVNIGLFGLGFTFVLMAFVKRIGTYWVGLIPPLSLLFLVGFCIALITIPTVTSFQQNTPENFRGRAYGLMGMFTSGIAVLPVLLAGSLADLFGVGFVLVVLGLTVMAFGVYRLRHGKVTI